MPAPETPRLLRSLGLLTVATGLVDAASVLGLGHVFTANMTGNVVFFGFSLAGAGRAAASDCAFALVAFLLGALVGGRLANRGTPFRLAIALEAIFLLTAAFIAWAEADGPCRGTGRPSATRSEGIVSGAHLRSVCHRAGAARQTTARGPAVGDLPAT